MGELGSAEYPETVNIRGYKPNTSVHIGQLKRAIKMLGRAKKPLFLAGGGVIISRANEVFTKLVEKTNIPVVTTVMGRGAIPTNHPLYIGNLGMHGAYACNMLSVIVICCFQSELGSMTELPESCIHLHRMHRLYISILIQLQFQKMYR